MVQAYLTAFRLIGNRIEQIGNSGNMILFNGPGVLCRVPIDRKSIGNRIEQIGPPHPKIEVVGPSTRSMGIRRVLKFQAQFRWTALAWAMARGWARRHMG